VGKGLKKIRKYLFISPSGKEARQKEGDALARMNAKALGP